MANNNSWLDTISCDLGLRQHLDAELDERENEYDFKATAGEWWRASDLGKDLYIRFLKRKGYESLPFDQRTMRKFEIGKLWEEKLHEAIDARIVKNKGNIKDIDLNPDGKLESERKNVVDTALNLRGHYDRLLLVKVNSTDWCLVVYEIKTVASAMFHRQKKEGLQPIHNIKQMMFYLERLQSKENFDKLTKIAQDRYDITPTKVVGVLSQVSKDDASMWEKVYEFNDKIYSEIKTEIETLNQYWQKDEMPPKPDLIVLRDGIAKLNWEITYSNFVHHILGDKYADIIKNAEQMVRSHYYYKKNNPVKLPEMEKKIAEFNHRFK